MILIKITKENREPKVGELYQFGKIMPGDQVNVKPLSLSVIPDAPPYKPPYAPHEEAIKALYSLQVYPISNSEEIFQWLHDQGKLGEEWVEWEGDHLFDWDDSVILRSTDEYCGICEKDLDSKVSKINETGEDDFAGSKDKISFDEWVDKYFEGPVTKVVRKPKGGGDWHTQDELIRRYNRAFKI